MTRFVISPIVEGHGDVAAVPVLLRRLHVQSRRSDIPLLVIPPLRVKPASFLSDPEYRQKYVELAALKALYGKGRPLVLILLDSEDECPARGGPDLLAKCRPVRPDVRLIVALAHREYETWFLAAAGSLAGLRNLPEERGGPRRTGEPAGRQGLAG